MKRFLLITYYWPPAGGVSVQRWLKLTKYLLKYGWVATVLTTENGDYPFTDDSLSAIVSENIEVYRTYTPTFGRWFFLFFGKK